MNSREKSALDLKQTVVPDIKNEVIAFANINGHTVYVDITDAVRAMILGCDAEHYEDRRSLHQDLTFTTLQSFFAQKRIKLEEQQFMTLGLKTRDGIYTNLALLLSEECPHEIKAAVFAGTTKTSPFQNRREFSGSLLSQMQEAYAMLEQYNQLGASFHGLMRTDQRDYPETALREALLNCIIHREYSYSGSTLINIFKDRIEFVSFGGLVQGLNLEDLKLGVSECRNEKMAALFYRLELIEAYGTGIPKIFESYQGSGLEPKLEASDHAFRITLPNRNIQREIAPPPASEARSPLLYAMKDKESFNRQDVQDALDISRSHANNLIRELVTEGYLTTQGKGKNCRYTQTKT